MNNQTIQLGSQSIFVSIKPGKAGTTPLLVCNGIGASTSLLTPFVEALHKSNPDIEIITFDSVGVGSSSTPAMPYRFSGLVKIIAQMLDHLNYAQVNVLGLSFGGFVAQEFAHSYPKRCRRLILAATTAGVVAVPPSLKVLSMMSSPRRYVDPDYAERVSPEIYGGKFRYDSELVRKHVEKVANSKTETPQSQLGYLYQQMAVTGWSSLPWLHTIKQPTLLLGGSDDPLVHIVNMKVMNRLLPDSKLYIVDDGHLFLITSIEDVLPIIEEFLS